MRPMTFDCEHRYDSGFTLRVNFRTAGGVTALVGPSGSGKTTVLSIIAGILRPPHGRVTLGDRVLLDTTSGICVPPEQRRIGLVFQDHLLFPHLSVRGNLLFGARRAGRDSGMNLAHVAEVLELRDVLERSPHTLSGGQKQRVALGRAIMCGPDLLLMDEPLAGLDDALRGRVLDYVERIISEYRLPTLLVSHHRADVARLADQVVRLDHGLTASEAVISAP